jgi:hypothetical protein
MGFWGLNNPHNDVSKGLEGRKEGKIKKNLTLETFCDVQG